MLLTISAFTSFAILIRIIANPLSNVFQKQLTQQAADPLFVISATYGLLLVACLLLWPQLQFIGLPAAFWQTMIMTGLLATIGNVFLVKALHMGDLSVLGPINAYKSVVGILIGIVLLNEVPSWWGLTGVMLILAGSYVVLSTKQQQKQFSWRVFQRPAVQLRLLALVFSAIDGVFLKKAILLSTPTIAFFYWCVFGFGFSGVWIALAMRRQWRTQRQLLWSHRVRYVALAVTVGITQMASNVALVGLQVGYVLALFQTSALVSVLFGYQFFNERGVVRKLIGAGIMVGGAVLIIVLR